MSIEKQKTTPEDGSGVVNQSVATELESKERRTLIRKLALGTAALAGCSVLPDKWTVPLVEFGVLPAHATTSGEAAAEAAAEPTETDVAPAKAATNDFNLLFVETYQACSSCGIWFDSAQLVVRHSLGTYKYSQTGGLLIKESPNRLGYFRANLASIPASASIQNATLYMRLNPHEGIANSDNSSVITVYDYTGGKKGAVVKTITAANDIKGKGYSKANPEVPVDFTSYARQVHGG